MTARPGDIERLLANRWTHGKSFTKHYYTVQDIARITGRAVGTVRNDSAAGRIDLDDLASVVKYCTIRSKP